MNPTATRVAALAALAMTAGFLPGSASAATPASAATGTRSVVATASGPELSSRQGTLDSRVRGTFGRNGVVRGSFTPERFIVRKGETYAVGTLDAVLRRGDGTLVGRTSRQVQLPVRNASNGASASAESAQGRSCDILNLVLGPLDLDLLGLQVHLNRVVLDIVAQSGASNLLGNLLCPVAGLLDGSQLRLANVLNRILSILD